MDYKELVSKQEESWKVLASFSMLPTSTEGKPLEAYNKDSQAGAFLSRGVLSTARIKKRDQAIIDIEIQKLLTAFNLLRPVGDELESIRGVLDKEND
jgi:hypothetical protein